MNSHLEKEIRIFKRFENYELLFNSYYKYSFFFKYKDENIEINGHYGGDPSDIYKYDVDTNPVKLCDIGLCNLEIIENGNTILEVVDNEFIFYTLQQEACDLN
jgi:hypothetical protein